MNREIEIKKIKLKQDKVELSYDEIMTDDVEGVTINLVMIEGGHKPHPDLIHAMSRLNIHGAIITEQVKVDAKKGKGQTTVSEGGALITIPVKLEDGEMRILDSCTTYGFSIGGDEEKPGVVLSIKRKLTTGKVIIINSPFTEFNQENGYKYRSKLAEDIECVCQEAQLYLEGKKAPDPQLEMEFAEKSE